jgi:hypothetical protein
VPPATAVPARLNSLAADSAHVASRDLHVSAIRLTVELRGRAEAPAIGAEGAQSLSARGANQEAHHGPLQRWLDGAPPSLVHKDDSCSSVYRHGEPEPERELAPLYDRVESAPGFSGPQEVNCARHQGNAKSAKKKGGAGHRDV